MHIYGVVSTLDAIFVDPLCAPVLLLSTAFDEANSVRCTRHLQALKRVIKSLETFYGSAAPAPAAPIPMSLDVPHRARGLGSDTIDNIGCRGQGQCLPCDVQRPQLKIALRDCVEVHELCASRGFAPELFHVQPMGVRGDVAVIMEDCTPAVTGLLIAEEARDQVRRQCTEALKFKAAR
jgi:hypothetical protein